MKKTLAIFSAILIGVYVLLSLLDSSHYNIEKKLWFVQKQFDEIKRDPKVVPEQKFEEIVRQYRAIINNFPESSLIPGLYDRIGKTYLLKKDYAKVRETYQEIIDRYPDNRDYCAEALLNVSVSYEAENNVKEAAKTLQEILDTYPDTDVGLNIPIYTANFYMRVDKPVEAKTAFRDATFYYRKLANENENTSKGFNAIRLLATTYLAQKKWEEAVFTFSEILMQYAQSEFLSSDRARLMIRSINTISISQLKDYELPIKIYNDFIQKNPDHTLNPGIKDVISGLKELKARNVTVKKAQE